MRRLRTLADKYYGADPSKGRLRQVCSLAFVLACDALLLVLLDSL